MLRPAIAAGAAIVAMETLTDFATVQYFSQETVTVGVFRIWRGTYDRDAASEIATLVLVLALFAIGLERVLRGRARFGESAGEAPRVEPRRAARVAGRRGDAVAATVVVTLAFLAPSPRLVDVGDRRAAQRRGARRWSRATPSSSATACTLTAVTVGHLPRRVDDRRQRPAVQPDARSSASPTASASSATPCPGRSWRWASCSPSSPLDDLLERARYRPARLRRDGLVHRPRVRLRDPLPRRPA